MVSKSLTKSKISPKKSKKKSKRSPRKSPKKSPRNKVVEKEHPFDAIVRKRKEKELAEQQAKIQEELNAKKEEERKHKIIYNYMEKLAPKFKELFGKDSNGYRVWVDAPSKKITKPPKYFRDLLDKSPEKYKDKKYAEIYLKPHHKDHGKQTGLFRDPDTWIDCNIKVFKVGKNGKWTATYGCKWTWRTDDFKVSKFSFKLINKLIEVVSNNIYTCGQLSGEPLSFMIKNMKKRGVKFGELLQPLTGV